ncbi:MAG: AsnC family transcriptional regulator [Bacteroidia bacterium]|nr:AsnC family transcriptional regulator [Bacteroidia bacterium]
MKRRRETMDQLDRQLLVALAENPTESYSKVREKLGVSIGTVYLRTQRLRDWGVIKGSQLLLDPKKLGYSLTVAVRLHVPDTQKALKALEVRPEIGVVHVLSGELNLLVYAYLREVNDLHALLQFFAQDLKADRTEVQILLDTPIQRGVPIPQVEGSTSTPRRGTVRKAPPTRGSKK